MFKIERELGYLFAAITCFIIAGACAFAAFADDPVSATINGINMPAWAKFVITTLMGGGFVGAIVLPLILKIFPWFSHSLSIFKQAMKIITSIKPIMQDAYVVQKYGDVLAEYNSIVDETEEMLNDAKVIKTQNFLEKLKIKTIDHDKVMTAIKVSPVIAAAESALFDLDNQPR